MISESRIPNSEFQNSRVPNAEKLETDYRYLCHVLRNGTASIEGALRQVEGILKGMSKAVAECLDEMEKAKINDSASEK